MLLWVHGLPLYEPSVGTFLLRLDAAQSPGYKAYQAYERNNSQTLKNA